MKPTSYKEQCPSSEADSRSAIQEMFILLNPGVDCNVRIMPTSSTQNNPYNKHKHI
jgi:hypothetical protein